MSSHGSQHSAELPRRDTLHEAKDAPADLCAVGRAIWRRQEMGTSFVHGGNAVALKILDAFSVGIILLDPCARVVFANRAAYALTGEGSALRLRGARFASASTAHARRLREIIQSALGRATAGAMSFPTTDDGRKLTVVISPMHGSCQHAVNEQAAGDAAAMVVLCDAARPREIPAHWIIHAFGLTLAEARVALSTATGASVPETARRLAVAPSTVRTHLREVFAKTGAHRQADLARLIASVGLLRGDSCGGQG